MRFLAAVLTALLLASTADGAAFVRKPRVAVYSSNVPTTGSFVQHNENRIVTLLKAHGCETYLFKTPHMKPLIHYSQGLVRGGTWALGYPWAAFDASVFIGTSTDWLVGLDGVRLDSMSRVGKYNTIPTLFVEPRFGFGTTGGICSTGVDLTQNQGQFFAAANPQVVSLTGTSGHTSLTGMRGHHVTAGTSSGALVTKLLESTIAGSDTTFVWKRASGAGMTFVTTSTDDGQNLSIIPMLLGINQMIADLPDSVRPRIRHRWGWILDEAGMRNRSSAAYSYEDIAANVPTTLARPGFRSMMDSLRTRGIKATVSYQFMPDSMNLVEANGLTRIANEQVLFAGDNFRFYVHNHGGYDAGSNAGNASAVNRKLYDTFGGSRDRECDPLSASDSSIYALNAEALALARETFPGRVSYSAGPPSGDYSPRNLLTSTCKYDDLLASLRRAGYRSIVATGNASGCGHGKNLNSAASNGYDCGPRIATTPYGDIGIMFLNPAGGSPLGSDSTALSNASRASVTQHNLASYFLGHNGSIVGSHKEFYSPVLTGHIRTFTGQAPMWTVVRDLDNVFRAVNRIAGYEAYGWDFTDNLQAVPWW